MDFPANRFGKAMQILAAVVLTAGAYFVSSGLHRVWWPVWFAPLPVLLLAPRLRAWQAFAVALVARGLAAAFNFWHYVGQVVQLPLWLLLVMILVPAASFALAIVFYRGLLRKGSPWLAMLAFPVTMVAAEYLFSLSQGTFLNTGYTQLENLPILQLAAITGLWGISFSVNLFPAGLAALVAAPAKLRVRMAAALVAFFACVLFYGVLRLLTMPPAPNSVLVGLVETHAGRNIFPQDAQTTMALMQEYASQVQPLAARGAQFVVFPEMSALIPDVEINLAIRAEMQERGLVSKEEHRIEALVPRQDLTGPERTWAARYEFNDVVRYARASKETGVERGEYARVKSVDAEKNLLTVVRADGSELTYDPRRQQGVSVYREEPRSFAVGDRIQFTAPANDLKVANRELGTIESIHDGKLSLKMDGGRNVQLDPREHPHIDHGYAVTSHSSQGQTAERVLIHVDTELAAKDLLNSRMAYVSVSRGADDAQLYTNDRAKLPEALGHDVSHESAHAPVMKPEQAIKPPQPEIAPVIERGFGMGHGL